MSNSATNSSDPGAPRISDYELLQRIGQGGYGEVYLGRSVTGKLRAIKTVRRANFESGRAFEREFEGIQHYEELSREHPGLAEILHVGRNDEQGFYYYIMRLADNAGGDGAEDGDGEPDPETYEPLTLSRMLRPGRPLPMEICLRVGRSIAGGLDHLHRQGLAHRDIKPSNIIFVKGVPQLADPGLVAASGQKTFVGTEGYVPPEGPGSPLADLYGLGIVLYEMNTGQDRLDFPELPAKPNAGERDRRQRVLLNEVLCAAADPQPSRRYPSGAALAAALEDLASGRLRRPRRRIPALFAAGLTVPLLLAAALLVRWTLPGGVHGPENRPALFRDLRIEITSEPPGARVSLDGRDVGTTPLVEFSHPGTIDLQFEREGHRGVTMTFPVRRGKENRITAKLGPFLLPIPGKPWRNHLGHQFSPIKGEPDHRSDGSIREAEFLPFVEAVGEDAGLRYKRGGGGVIFAAPDTQERYCAWMTSRDRADGRLRPDQLYMQDTVEPLDGSTDLESFATVVGPQRRGTVQILSRPNGAAVSDGTGAPLGETPLTLAEVAAGPVDYILSFPGHVPQALSAVLPLDEDLELKVELEGVSRVRMDTPWTNGLGMTFMPVGPELLGAIHETTLNAFEVFQEEEARSGRYFGPGVAQPGNYPVTHVSREDARRFCAWLTRKERVAGRIPIDVRYRLPTDREWSRMAGLPLETGRTPRKRDREYLHLYPWGRGWPPPPRSGNFAGIDPRSRAGETEVPEVFISGYSDGFPHTAPVGSFPANRFQLHDLGGNVSEWVEDSYDEDPESPFPAVLRGGNWDTASPDQLRLSYRGMSRPDLRSSRCGFRTVLSRDPQAPPVEPVTIGPG